MVVTLQVESGMFINRRISNRIWNLYLIPSPLSIRMLLENGQRCSSKKITSFWRVSKDYDKLSLGDENGFLCEMVGQGSAQVLGENGLPKWSRIGSLVRWLCFWHIGRFQRLLKLQSIMHLQIVEFYGKIIRCTSSSSFRSTTRCRSQATCPNSLFNRHNVTFLY